MQNQQERVKVGLVCDLKPEEPYDWHAVPVFYVEGVMKGSHAAPVLLPALGGDVYSDAFLQSLDGFFFTGARSNVNPARYGKVPSKAYEPYDEARDETTLSLIVRVLELGIPMLAICRGMQELNVALGGTLETEIQELPGRQDHRAEEGVSLDQKFEPRHEAFCEAGGLLLSTVGEPKITVNSLHRQAVEKVGPGLKVEARAEDGTVEALSVENAKNFALGVQWHPEYLVGRDQNSDRIFARFGDACRAYRESKTV